MTNQTTVAVGPDRRPVARKRATSPSGAERLRHEAAMLNAARHPRVVTVVDLDASNDGALATLTTAWVPGGSLAGPAATRRSPADQVRLMASAAATVADLHDRGIVHGRLTADHVLVDDACRAVLTGFADAEQHGQRLASDDVAALGRLTASLTATLATSRSARRLARRLAAARPGGGGDLIQRLGDIGRRAADPLPTRRPSARSLARQLAELLPDAGTSDTPRRRFGGGGRGRGRAAIVIVVAGAAAIAGAVGVLGGRARSAPPNAPDAPVSAPPSSGPGGMPPSPGTTPPDPGATTVPGTTAPHGASVSVAVTGVLVAPEPTAAPGWTAGSGASTHGPDTVSAVSTGPATAGSGPSTHGPDADSAAPATTDGADAGAGGCLSTAEPAATPAYAAVDLDGDGCTDTVAIHADGTVHVGGYTFELAADPNDRALVGDWDCDGIATLAVVRLPSGAVDVFTAWPGRSSAPMVADRVTEVTGALDADTVAGDGGRCADIAVRTSAGTTIVTRRD